MWAFALRVCVHVLMSSRFLLFFFFFGPHLLALWGQILLLWTVNILFTYCADTVHALKNIKNGYHDTIYTFKNYFATVFSVFSFSNNKLTPNEPYILRYLWACNSNTNVHIVTHLVLLCVKPQKKFYSHVSKMWL